jgi:NAD(P)-dependent dehydrogenase (short-subunit alcohol dehydrogenase family)
MSWDIGNFDDVVSKDGPYCVLVVGAGSGIGKATVGYLASQGAAVVCADRDSTAAEAVTTEIVSHKGRAIALRLDVTDEE